MIPSRLASLKRHTAGATSLEFAILASALFLLLFGCIEGGLLMWTRGTLQSVAAQTARCSAVTAPLCASASQSKQYAVNLAQSWLGTALIVTADVTITTPSTCGSGNAPGTFQKVIIAAPSWVGAIAYPFGAHSVNVTACFPT